MLRWLVLTIVLHAGLAWSDEIRPGVLRTPESRFDNLKGYPFLPNYLEIDGLRVHYLDEGPPEGDPILLLHGEPTWSYLFRKMIPVLTAAGHRVIAPDMIGFGRSDKLANRDDYSYPFHIHTMVELVNRLNLRDATFFGQDWGGLVGLRVVSAVPDRFARVVVSNTGLPSASGITALLGEPIFKLLAWWEKPVTIDELLEDPSFARWVAYAYYGEDLSVAAVMKFLGNVEDPEVIQGYDAPYPDARYKAGAQVFPYLIPTQLTENQTAWEEVFEQWDKPFLIAFTDLDPVTSGTDMAEQFEQRVPGATRVVIGGVGHFVQEEAGAELAALINDFIAGRPVTGF
ncbi:MAG: haloalkane dehalogenase [Pseudomonadota bacterium]